MFDDKEFATRVAALAEECGAKLNEIHRAGEEHLSREHIKTFRYAVGTVMAYLNTEIMLPIYQRYPELQPPKQFGDRKQQT